VECVQCKRMQRQRQTGVPDVIEPSRLPGLAMAIMGSIAGIGYLLVRPAPGELERLDRLWPMTRFLRPAAVRIVFSILGFAFAGLGLALSCGWLG